MKILRQGFVPSEDGLFGPGVYLTSSLNKAWAWAKHRASPKTNYLKESYSAAPTVTETAVVVSVTVTLKDLGRCKTFDMKQVRDSDYLYVTWHRKFAVWNDLTKDLRSASLCAWSGTCGHNRNKRMPLYKSFVEDGLGRLPFYNLSDSVSSPCLSTVSTALVKG